MPQMSPLLWMNLYITFSITLVIFIAVFFFTKIPTSLSSTQNEFPKEKLNWKW